MGECGKMPRANRPIALVFAFGIAGVSLAPAQGVEDRLAEARRTVEAVRGRAFKHSVPSEAVGPGKLKTLLEQKLAEGLVVDPDDYFRSLAAIGAIAGADLPGLRDRLLDFYGGQVLAFYDPGEGKFFVSSAAREKLGGFSGVEESLVFTHELTHALQDQYLSLDRRFRDLRSDGDAALAMQALLEGEATEVMIESAVADLPGADESVEAMLAPLLTSSLADLEPGAAKVPSFFSEQLFFPYTDGTAYIRERKRHGGWKAIDAAWNSPPVSTSEILHPGAEVARIARPLLADSEVAPPSGSKFLYSDTLGEWTLRFLFRKAGAEDADKSAAAWKADRFLFFKNGQKIGYAGRIRASDPAAALRILSAWKKLNPASDGSVKDTEVSVYSGFEKSPF
jgi:hypothetical protein